MRFDLIEFLSLLVKEGYIISFRVTKSKIFVAIKNDRRFFLLMKPCGLWQACPVEGGKKQPGNGAEIMKTPLYIFNYRGGHCRGAVGTCTE